MESPLHVVTGAFGYSGQYIARRLLDKGHTVRTLTNSPDRENPFGGPCCGTVSRPCHKSDRRSPPRCLRSQPSKGAMERYRIQSEAAVYFVTYCVVEWLPVFVSQQACRIVTESLEFCHREKGLRVNAYVIMPTHLHAIVFDRDFDWQRLETSLAEFRRFTGHSLSNFASERMPSCFGETLRAEATADRHRRFWQPSRHPEALLSENVWKQKLDYLHENPCRKGLVVRADHWRFSSAGFYLSDGEQPSDVAITPIDW